MEPISLAFRYSEQDYVKAMRLHYASRPRLPLDVAVIIIAAGLGAYELRSGSHMFGVALVALSGAFGLMLVAAFTLIPKVTFQRQPKFHDDYSLLFSPEGIHFRTTHIDSALDWNIYTRALIGDHSIVLYWDSQQFTVIPRRVFANPSQEQSFRQLLNQKVRTIVDKTKARSM